MKLLVINGPNLNMLGIREPDIYGKNTYEELVRLIEKTCEQKGIEVEIYQSNTEGFIVDKIQQAYGNTDGIIPIPALPYLMLLRRQALKQWRCICRI